MVNGWTGRRCRAILWAAEGNAAFTDARAMIDTTAASKPVRRLAGLALAGAIYTYILVVYGGIVRITGSGMGCGDDWPNCNDAIVPTFDLTVFIEYSHRVLAAGLSLLTLWILGQAIRHRALPGVAGRGGVGRPAWLAAALIVAQVLLGALTVKLELPAGVTALHFMTAMTLLATFLVLAVRGGVIAVRSDSGGDHRFAFGVAALGFLVVALGALTANVGMDGPFPPSGAAIACRGFPLCNGQIIPDGDSWTHIHWTHRLLAFGLLGAALWGAWRARRLQARAVRAAAYASAALVVAQVAVAAALVLAGLPEVLQTAHLAVGGLVWSALVLWALLARRAARAEQVVGMPVVA